MSVRHPELVDLVEALAAGERLTPSGWQLLAEYGELPISADKDQLDRVTRESVEALTGSDGVWSPGRAAKALLAVQVQQL